MKGLSLSAAFGAVLQGSLFGLVGLLPQKYSTVFMSGQGLAGTFAAVAMLLAIASEPPTCTQNTAGCSIPSCLVAERIQNKWRASQITCTTQCVLFQWTVFEQWRHRSNFSQNSSVTCISCARHSGDADSESAALGYFITPCVGTLVTLFSYLLLPRLVSELPALLNPLSFTLTLVSVSVLTPERWFHAVATLIAERDKNIGDWNTIS